MSAQKVAAVACERWLPTRGSNYSVSTGKFWYVGSCMLGKDSLTGRGRLREVVARGGSAGKQIQITYDT